MSERRGKKAAIAACVVAMPIVVLALWKPALEAWQLHRLRDEGREVEERLAAVRALVELRCYRALPEMARFVCEKTDSPHRGPHWEIFDPLQGAAVWPYLLESQMSEVVGVRLWAWNRIAETGREDAEALKAFRRALEDEDEEMRVYAAQRGASALGSRAVKALADIMTRAGSDSYRELHCLVGLGPLALEAEDAVRQSLQTMPEGDWSEIVCWLEEIGGHPRPDLELALHSIDPAVRLRAASELGKRELLLKDIVETFLVLRRWKDEKIREDALDELKALALRDPAALEPLLRAGGDADAAFLALDPIGVRSIPVLLRVFFRGPPETSERAWKRLEVLFSTAQGVLESLPDDSPEYVEKLIHALEGVPDSPRANAIEDLVALGPAAMAAVPALERLLSSESLDVRIDAARALAAVEPEREIPWRFLLEHLQSKDEHLPAALWALMALGPRAAESVPALLLIDDPGWTPMCTLVLRCIGWPAWIEHMGPAGSTTWERVVALLEKEAFDARAIPLLRGILHAKATPDWIWPAIQRLGLDASPLAPDLASVAFSPVHPTEEDVYGDDSAAVETLGFLGPDAALPLMEFLKRHQGKLIEQALQALARIGPGAAASVPILLDVMRRRPAEQQVEAARTLFRIGAAAVPGLVGALGDPSEDVRCLAAHALGRMGAAAAPAAQALRMRLEDPSSLVRRTAERALSRLGPK